MVEVYQPPPVYERTIHYDREKEVQVRLVVNSFRGVEYLHIRKYYLSFEEIWMPSNEGIAIPLDLNNSKELFTALTEILSLAESREVIEYSFKDLIKEIYTK